MQVLLLYKFNDWNSMKNYRDKVNVELVVMR